MKKMIIALSVGLTSFAALSTPALAQNSVHPIAFNETTHLKSSVRMTAALESTDNMGTYTPDTKNISVKALKDFSARFDNSSNAQWFADKNGFVSYFVKNGYGNRAYYDKKGRWQYSLLFYGEDKLPRDLRAIVKSTYYDLTITLVEEVQTVDGMVYVIHLEDKTLIRIIKVNKEGEMETIQDLSKE